MAGVAARGDAVQWRDPSLPLGGGCTPRPVRVRDLAAVGARVDDEDEVVLSTLVEAQVEGERSVLAVAAGRAAAAPVPVEMCGAAAQVPAPGRVAAQGGRGAASAESRAGRARPASARRRSGRSPGGGSRRGRGGWGARALRGTRRPPVSVTQRLRQIEAPRLVVAAPHEASHRRDGIDAAAADERGEERVESHRGKHIHARSPRGPTMTPRSPSARSAYSRRTWGRSSPSSPRRRRRGSPSRAPPPRPASRRAPAPASSAPVRRRPRLGAAASCACASKIPWVAASAPAPARTGCPSRSPPTGMSLTCWPSNPVRPGTGRATPGASIAAEDRLHGAVADPQLAAVVVGGPVDRLGRRSRADRSAAPAADGRGSFERHQLNCGVFTAGQLHHRDPHLALVVQQLGADRVGEPADPELGAAVCGLQRDRTVGERRADLHDLAAVARRSSAAAPPSCRRRCRGRSPRWRA